MQKHFTKWRSTLISIGLWEIMLFEDTSERAGKVN